MINPTDFLATLFSHGSHYITGVPDSLLKGLLQEVLREDSPLVHIDAVNEGNAVVIASGLYMTTGQPQVVYFQNSGIGNAVNPLVSLSHKNVYATPMLLIIGWRGEPGLQDEPQHMVQGAITTAILDSMNIPYFVLDENFKNQITRAYAAMNQTNQPFALLIKKSVFSNDQEDFKGPYMMNRRDLIQLLLTSMESDSLVLCTTGKSGRELYEIREELGLSHEKDFLSIGAMGHLTGLATGITMSSNKKIYILDGDGALMMHMGGLFNLVNNSKGNFKYILINNGSHQSVGGQPSPLAMFDESRLLHGLGFESVTIVQDESQLLDLKASLSTNKKDAIVIRVSNDSQKDLTRPKEKPIDNKLLFMRNFKKS